MYKCEGPAVENGVSVRLIDISDSSGGNEAYFEGPKQLLEEFGMFGEAISHSGPFDESFRNYIGDMDI